MAQSLLALWRGDACGLAFWLKVLMVAYQTSMLALFGAFFVDAYSRRRSKGKGKVA